MAILGLPAWYFRRLLCKARRDKPTKILSMDEGSNLVTKVDQPEAHEDLTKESAIRAPVTPDFPLQITSKVEATPEPPLELLPTCFQPACRGNSHTPACQLKARWLKHSEITYKGDPEDWIEHIANLHQQLSLQQPGDPKMEDTLNRLAFSLLIRFKHESAVDDLNDAITQLRTAVNLRHPGDPGRWLNLTLLSSALRTRFQKWEGGIDDMNESTACTQEALLLKPN